MKRIDKYRCLPCAAQYNRVKSMLLCSDGMLYWKEDRKDNKQQKRPWFRPYYRPRSADIEITSYALLVYAQRRDRKNGLAIARWLAQQKNSLGGYSSTQVHSDYIATTDLGLIFQSWVSALVRN